MAVQAAVKSLRELLDFLETQQVDVAVFPEYLHPAASLQDLMEFSAGRVVVAGLEEVRNNELAEQLAQADERSTARLLLKRNVSTLIADRRVRFITKRYRANSESAASGAGPVTVEAVIRGRTIRIGVAVCLDYLRAEDEVREANAEILCVPAYTPTLNDFYPAAPRDHVRLLANCALHGGSRIMLPGLKGRLVDDLGVRPLPKGAEGVVIVDYDRYPSRPSGYKSPDNTLYLRAEVIERSNQVCLNLIKELANDPSVEQLTALINRVPHPSPLRDLLVEYRQAKAGDAPDPELRRMVRDHPIVGSGARSAAVRHRQAKHVVGALSSMTPDREISVGAATDAYRRLIDTLPAGSEPAASVEDQDECPLETEPEVPGQERQLLEDVPDLEAEGLIAALERQLLEDLIDRADALWSRTRAVRAAPTARELLRRSLSAQDTLAELTDLVDNVVRLSESGSGFTWHNELGHVRRQLGALRNGLPTDHLAARAAMREVSRRLLVDAAEALYNALTRLRRPAP
ncbi:hypothetical protein [Nonomuraea sp. NPDC049480]|uniref:hypothetical protein n=1 Tax=Nonomuraea sp. NPDC049480 TaxID=3364353 RepID=UPI00379A0524